MPVFHSTLVVSSFPLTDSDLRFRPTSRQQQKKGGGQEEEVETDGVYYTER
jgi:hypothetical protein